MSEKYTLDLLRSLPKQPLPELEETLSRLTEWSQPLLGASEQNKLADQTAAFKKNDGPALQALLKQRWTETNANWLVPFWRQQTLMTRAPLQVTSNFALTVEPARLPNMDQVTMAAKLLQNFADEYLAYIAEEVPVDTDETGKSLDMSSYQYFFRTQRHPGIGRDHLQMTRQATKNVEATVIYHHTLYQIRLIDHAGRVSTLHSLTEALNQIIASPDTDTFFVGSYSGLPRNEAAELWQRLTISERNQANLRRVSGSLLVLTLLDSSQAITAPSALLGPLDRLFDKTTQVIVASDGQIGFAFEHSQINVQPAISLVDKVVNHLSQPADQWDSKGKPHFQKLDWQLDHDIKEALAAAENQNVQLADQLTFASTTEMAFGTQQLQELGVDPDGFIQIALALTEFHTTGEWRTVAESASLRQFYQGRAEKFSSISQASKQFISAFTAGQRDAVTKQLFDHALHAHQDWLKKVQKGLGIDSHLASLKLLMAQYGGPSVFPEAAVFFQSPFLTKFLTDYFLTINLSEQPGINFIFPPASPNGYAISYELYPDQVAFAVSAWTATAFEADELLTDFKDSLDTLFAWLAAFEND